MTQDETPGKAVARPKRPGRRFGDDEVGAILDRAADLQERSSGVTAGAARGLTLEELRQIAKEAGIDPRFVDIASADLAAPVEGKGREAAGAPYRWHYNSTIPGEINDGDRDRILQAIRSILGKKGELADVFGRMEWTFDDGTGPVIIGITSRGGVVEIDIAAEKAGEMGLYFGLGMPFGGLLLGTTLAAAVGLTGPLVMIPIASGVGASYLAMRFGWQSRSKWWERRIARLKERIESIVQDVAVLPPPSDGDDGP